MKKSPRGRRLWLEIEDKPVDTRSEKYDNDSKDKAVRN